MVMMQRIICQVDINQMIVDQHALPYDSVTIGDREITSMSFRLTDCFGKTVQTQGHAISLSIIFIDDE